MNSTFADREESVARYRFLTNVSTSGEDTYETAAILTLTEGEAWHPSVRFAEGQGMSIANYVDRNTVVPSKRGLPSQPFIWQKGWNLTRYSLHFSIDDKNPLVQAGGIHQCDQGAA